MNRMLILLAALVFVAAGLACGIMPTDQLITMVAPPTSAPFPTSIPAPPTTTPAPSPTPIPTATPPPPTPTPVEGPGYGGHYIDPEDDSIVYIYLVNPSQEAAEKVARTHISSLVYEGIRKVREVRPVQAKYTFRQLQRWYDQLRDSGIWDISELTMSDVDEGINRIEYGIDCERNRDRLERQIRDILSRENVPQDAVKVTVSSRAFFPEYPDDFECALAEVVDPVTGISSPGFGGLFIDFDTRTTNVYLLEPSQEKAEELALAIIGGDDLKGFPNVRTIQGRYTWEQLVEWWYRIVDESNPNIQGASFGPGGFHADPFRNRLVVEVNRERNADVETDVGDFLDRIGVPVKQPFFWGTMNR